MEPSIDYKSSKPNLKRYLIIIVLVILLTISTGWNLYSANGLRIMGTKAPQSNPPEGDSSLFDNQSANFTGKITAVNGNKLTVKNNRDITGEITVASSPTIFRFSNLPASPSSDLKTIETNKDVAINLQVKDGRYVAVSISYISAPPPVSPENIVRPSGLPSFPPVPPSPSPVSSAKLKNNAPPPASN
jgi:hypothetical protein